VWRHESLRTTIVVVDGVPLQKFDAACKYEWSDIDMSGLPPMNLEGELARLIEDFVRVKITLSVGPLFSVRIFRLSDCEHVLVFALDHMITDGASIGILIKEVWTLYGQAKRGLRFSLPTPTLQFGDYAAWLQRTYGAWLQQHAPYWTERLTCAPRIEIPVCDNLARAADPIGAQLEISLGDVLSSRLREIARRERTPLPIVALSIYLAVMSHWCNQRDLVVLFVTDGRWRMELRDVVGYVAHELYLRIGIGKEDTFLDLLAKSRLEFYAAYEHLNFGRIYELAPEYKTEIWFNWLPAQGAQLIADCHLDKGGNKLTVVPFVQSVALPMKFIPLFYDGGSAINVMFNYHPDRLTPNAVRCFANNLRLFAEEFVQNPLCRIDAASIKREMQAGI